MKVGFLFAGSIAGNISWTTLVAPWYDMSMTLPKRKISVSLDSDLVSVLERNERSLSAQINDALRVEMERQKRQRWLSDYLDRLDEEHGPVEEELMGKYRRLLE